MAFGIGLCTEAPSICTQAILHQKSSLSENVRKRLRRHELDVSETTTHPSSWKIYLQSDLRIGFPKTFYFVNETFI